MKVAQAGVDTWSLAWYVAPDSSAQKAIEALATVPSARGRRMLEKVLGHTIGTFTGTRMIYAEGRPGGDRLASASELPQVEADLEEALGDLGIQVRRARKNLGPGTIAKRVDGEGRAGVRRLDLTADLRFDGEAEGLSVLRGVAALSVPRLQTVVRTQPGGRKPETVYYARASGQHVARFYDKGVESGQAERGELIRPEDQRRFGKQGRMSVEHLGAPVLRTMFQRRFMPLWRASEGVMVASIEKLARRLGELQEAGEITPGQAKAIAGHLVLDRVGAHMQSRQARRDRALARRYGLVLAEAGEDELHVDLHAVLEQALEADDWYGEG